MKKQILFALLVVLGFSLCVSAQNAETFVFRAPMSPANEVPPVEDVQASGAALIRLHVLRSAQGDIVSGSVDFRVAYEFSGGVQIVGLHIHRGTSDVSGPVVNSSGLSGSSPVVDDDGVGVIERQAAVAPSNTSGLQTIRDILANPAGFYVNLHTTTHPAGVLRGQLQVAQTTIFRAAMSPANEVPPIPELNASGSARIIVFAGRDSDGNVNGGTVNFNVRHNFPTEVTLVGLHIHRGAAGVNGPVVISSGLTATVVPAGPGVLAFLVEVTSQAGIDALRDMLVDASQFYVNLHTSDNPGGAIRAPLEKAEELEFRAAMLPGNEVPPVPSPDALAAAKITLAVTRNNSGAITSGTVVFDVSFQSLTDPIVGLHIHRGVAGVNGPVLISSGLSGSNSVTSASGTGNIMRFADIDASNATGVQVLREVVANPARFYANMHTTTFPGGVVRGQLMESGEPGARIVLDPGTYVAEVELAQGQNGGFWALTIAGNLGNRLRVGGVAGTGQTAGFAAFALSTAATASFSLQTEALPGQPASDAVLRVFSLAGALFTSPSAPVRLAPGAWFATAAPTTTPGIFTLGVDGANLPFGAAGGGLIQPGVNGRVEFSISSQQEVRFQVLGRNFFESFGVGRLSLIVKDAQGNLIRRVD